MGPADKLNRTYEASNADVAAIRIRMTFTRNTKEGIPMSKFPTPEDVLKSQVKEFNKGNINFLSLSVQVYTLWMVQDICNIFIITNVDKYNNCNN
jgi:hypothetical protein